MWTIKNALAMSVGVACAAAGGVAYGSALDRSGQSLLGFLERGNYFEFGGSLLDASVKGVDMSGNPTGNVANAYNFVGATIKFQPFDKVSVGFIYDEPFGAAAEYEGENDFVTSPTDAVFAGLPVVTGPSIVSDGQLAAYGLDAGISGGTKVEVETSTLSAIVGYQPTENWNIYGGAVYQKVEGSVRLRGSTYSMFNGYDMSLPSTHEWGWLAGVAYEIPDIALKITLTYRSEIDYDANMRESLPLVAAVGANSAELGGLIQQLVLNGSIPAETGQAIGAALGNLAGGFAAGTTKVVTPQSVNLDFQTGIMADTLLFGNVRWVQWSKFSIQPAMFGQLAKAVGPVIGRPDGFNLDDYSKDQWSADLGLARRFNQAIVGSVSVGWDGGAGNPVSSLGPVEGYWNVGLGVRYSLTPKVELSGGVKYFWFGDAEAQTGAHSYAGEFKDNNAVAAGVKLGVHF